MPQHIERDYTALAVAQNLASWGELPKATTNLEAMCIPEFEASAHRSQARYLLERRNRLVERINQTIQSPRLFWDHSYFRHLAGSVLETDEAVTKLRKAISHEVAKCRNAHWSAKPSRVLELREAMVFARFFRRYGQRAWLRQMEAA